MEIFQVDAFTDSPFGGNPAAVCPLGGPADPDWMQRVAAEMNLSETAFVHPEGNGYHLRWFTPRLEVDLCGHATLATAHVLWEAGLAVADEPLRFATRSGVLTARREGEWIWLDLPADPPQTAQTPGGLEAALGAAPRSVGRGRFDLLVELGSEAELRALKPDFTHLERLPFRGVIVTSPAEGAGIDFASRFFAPGVGIPEDPVTGSAHCCLGPFWAARLGKTELTAHQVSARGGTLRVRTGGTRVDLGGRAVTVLRGRLTPPAVEGGAG